MAISEINSNNTISMLGISTTSNSSITKTNSSGELTDDYTESDETTKFKNIVSKYDITNISRNETNAMYKELYDNGLISLSDMAKATFDPTHIPGWQDGVSTINGAKVYSNSDEKINFLETLQTQVNWSKQYGDSKSTENLENALSLAEKIHYFQS